jgi:hypothetical protein
VLDRIRIWKAKNNSVHYEVKDKYGVPYDHSSMSRTEWLLLRSEMTKQLRSVAPEHYKFPPGSGFIVDYLVVLSLVAETS